MLVPWVGACTGLECRLAADSTAGNGPIGSFRIISRLFSACLLHLLQSSMKAVSSQARLLSADPKIGAHGNPVVFLHPKDMGGVLTELEEVKPQ